MLERDVCSALFQGSSKYQESGVSSMGVWVYVFLNLLLMQDARGSSLSTGHSNSIVTP